VQKTNLHHFIISLSQSRIGTGAQHSTAQHNNFLTQQGTALAAAIYFFVLLIWAAAPKLWASINVWWALAQMVWVQAHSASVLLQAFGRQPKIVGLMPLHLGHQPQRCSSKPQWYGLHPNSFPSHFLIPKYQFNHATQQTIS
jgi:hypothetical protein